jgi:hypothetical protein
MIWPSIDTIRSRGRVEEWGSDFQERHGEVASDERKLRRTSKIS